jgi:hypothetical protein
MTSFKEAIKKTECTIDGKTMTLGEWAKFQGLTAAMIRGRLKRGWAIQDAYTKPRGCRVHFRHGRVAYSGRSANLAR